MKLNETRYTINVREGQTVKYTWQTMVKRVIANALAWVILIVSFVLFVWSVFELLFG